MLNRLVPLIALFFIFVLAIVSYLQWRTAEREAAAEEGGAAHPAHAAHVARDSLPVPAQEQYVQRIEAAALRAEAAATRIEAAATRIEDAVRNQSAHSAAANP